ncbi:MAG TPA: NADH-quinone oxidoreductase subunit M [Candidatus Acidoferrum sp.]
MNGGHLLSVLIFLPAVGAFALLFLKNEDHLWIRRLSLVVGIVEFLLSFLPVFSVSPGTSGLQLQEFHHWISIPPINYHVGVDGISVFLVHLITFLTPIGILASWNDIKHRVKEFHIMLFLLEVGVVGIFLSLDLVLFFVFWEIGLIPLALLIGIWGHEHRIYAAVKFLLYTMAGSILMLVGIVWLYHLSAAVIPGGSFDLPVLQQLLQSGSLVLSPRTEMLLFLSFFLAFAIKVPLFPLHTWLPDAHTEAPTAGSVDLAGVLLKTGAYGVIRICLPLFPLASRRAAPFVAVLAIISIIYGALVALVQPNLKKLVAYSSVSHMGFVILGVFCFSDISMQGAVYVMLAHGISTGALFLLVGMLYERRHTFEISEFGGLATPMPRFAAFFLFAALSSLGLPLMNGFVGEFLTLLGTYQVRWDWAAWGATGVILSACYLLWSYQRVFLGEVTNKKNLEIPDTNSREKWVLVSMCILMLWLGNHSPFFTRRIAGPCNEVIQQMRRDFAREAIAPPKVTQPPASRPVAKTGSAEQIPLERLGTR